MKISAIFKCFAVLLLLTDLQSCGGETEKNPLLIPPVISMEIDTTVDN